MGEAGGWTTDSSSDCGAARSTKRSTWPIMAMVWRPNAAWADGSRITTGSGRIRRCAMRRPRRCTFRRSPLEPSLRSGRSGDFEEKTDEFIALDHGLRNHPKDKARLVLVAPDGLDASRIPRTVRRSGCAPAEP